MEYDKEREKKREISYIKGFWKVIEKILFCLCLYVWERIEFKWSYVI